MARAVDRIGGTELLLVEPSRPSERIIVEVNRASALPRSDMMGQRKVTEAEIARDFGKRRSERFFARQLAGLFDEQFYASEPPPLRSRPRRRARASKSLTRAESFSMRLTRVSQARARSRGSERRRA
jgi:hypothetical protein